MTSLLGKPFGKGNYNLKMNKIGTLNSAYNEKNMQRFCFIIGGFSLKGNIIIGE